MIVKDIIFEDFVNYKLPCMTIAFPYCTFKCEKDCGAYCCQNSTLAQSPNIDVSFDYVVDQYINNPITEAICFQGLEPFDSWEDMYKLVKKIRNKTNDMIVIFTGYNEDEITDKISVLKQFSNIIVKYGRFLNNNTPIFDEVLGVTLATSNQYAVKIS